MKTKVICESKSDTENQKVIYEKRMDENKK